MTSLVTHLHDFVREVKLTEAEWQAGIDFLTATGRICTDTRQEFILLSDHIFRDGDASLDSDVVFGVRSSLVGDYVEHAPGTAPDGTRVDTRFFTLDQTFALARAT